mgnify:CR=1 FL=1
MEAIHATSGAHRQVLGPWHRLWCFLFSWLYYASKGMWGWAVLSLFTLNGALVGFPLWNRGIVQRHYENAGWRIVAEGEE